MVIFLNAEDPLLIDNSIDSISWMEEKLTEWFEMEVRGDAK